MKNNSFIKRMISGILSVLLGSGLEASAVPVLRGLGTVRNPGVSLCVALLS